MSSVNTAYCLTRDAARVRGLDAVNWPLRDRPLSAGATLVACCVVGWWAGWMSRSASMGLLTALALALAMWKLWVPIRTELGPRGVTVTWLRRRRRIYWRDIDRLDLRDEGVFLCGQAVNGDCTALDSLYLPWGGDRAALADFCQAYVSGRPPQWSGATPSAQSR